MISASADMTIPLEERLRPDSQLHQQILAKLKARRDASVSHIEDRAVQWRETDDRLRMRIDLSKAAKKGDGTYDTKQKEMPFERSIVVPVSYSILQVLLTQMMSIFGSREPMIQLRGVGPDDVRKAQLMEAMLAYDLEEMNSFLSIFTLCQDSLKYGVGIIYDSWATQYGYSWKKNTDLDRVSPIERALILAINPDAQWKREFGPLKEHNSWRPVDPLKYYPDPKVPISQPQDGEWCGHGFEMGHMYFVENAQHNGGPYFNIEAIEKSSGSSGPGIERESTGMKDRDRTAVDELDRGIYECEHLQVKLIPNEWGLSEETFPEIWWFTWVNDDVIVRAHKCGYEHQEFTYAVAESAPDFHSAFNPGVVESLDGLQRYMDWMFNSHLQNLMRHLNDAMVFSPALIEQSDVTNPGPGRHIRLTELGEELLMSGGYSIDNFVHQLPIQDVTSPHLNAVNQMFNLAQRMSAANDPQMGMPTPDRRTLGEINVITASASQRISIKARLIDSMAIAKLAKRAISNRMQLTSIEQYYRITDGIEGSQGLEAEIIGRKDVIGGRYDYVYTDGILPPDPMKAAGTWLQTAQLVAQMGMAPDSSGRIPDISKIVKEGIRMMGVKNVNDYWTVPPQMQAPQLMPDEQVMAQEQAGNMVPVGGMM